MEGHFRKKNINSLRKEIVQVHLFFIIAITILFFIAGAYIQLVTNKRHYDQDLKDGGELIRRLYALKRNKSGAEIQAYFDGLVCRLANIDVLSIVNDKNIRIYHTTAALIGTHYDGTLPDFAAHGSNSYTEDSIGPSGEQRRTYSAVYDEKGRYCGFIMTIILKTSIRTIASQTCALFLFMMVFVILVELTISEIISDTIKDKLMGFEPDVFSAMYSIREKILETIYDGIIAVDQNNNIQFINKAAKNILNCDGTEKSMEAFAEKFLLPVINGKKDCSGLRDKSESGREIIVDCMQIKENDSINGAIAVLHDRTEYTKLIEELSGTKYLVDSMRANNHYFTNKLHVILGLIQIGQYEKAVSYIENISFIQRETLSNVMKAIDNPSFAALLIGKIARASECNVKFVLKEGINFKSSDVDIPAETLVTICGNLIDNAIDSMNIQVSADDEMRELVFGVFSRPHGLLITVDDTGCGIDEENTTKIFSNGFSTKGSGRGVGLYHTKQLVESFGGSISFESAKGIGTSFIVIFKGNEDV